MQFAQGQHGQTYLYTMNNGEKTILGWVLTTGNAMWTYGLSDLNIASPQWMSISDKEDMSACMIPYEEAYYTKREASMALLRVFGD